MGRCKAHATYHASHGSDETTGLTFGMDLTPLIEDPSLDINVFVQTLIGRFMDEVKSRLAKLI